MHISDSNHENQIYTMPVLSSILAHENCDSHQTRLLRVSLLIWDENGKICTWSIWLFEQASLGLLLYLSINSPDRLYSDLLRTENKFHDGLPTFFFFFNIISSTEIPTAYPKLAMQKHLENLKWSYCHKNFKEYCFKGQLKEEYHIMQ